MPCAASMSRSIHSATHTHRALHLTGAGKGRRHLSHLCLFPSGKGFSSPVESVATAMGLAEVRKWLCARGLTLGPYFPGGAGMRQKLANSGAPGQGM